MAIIQLSAATIEALKIAARLLLLHQWWQQDANSSLDTNESLEFQSQHQMSDVAGWHFATCSGVPLYFVLACTWSKATLGSDNHSHGSWTNIVMAPTDTSARSFSSTSSCIKKKVTVQASAIIVENVLPNRTTCTCYMSVTSERAVVWLRPWRTGFFFGDAVI